MSKYSLITFWRYLILKSKLIPEKNLLMIIAVIIGIVAAMIVYAFEGVVEGIKSLLDTYSGISGVSVLYYTLPIVGIIIVTLFVKYLIKDSIGHGVTRVMRSIAHKRAHLKPHNVYSSAIAGAITIGFGGSVGPEAPIVMTGSALGSNIAKSFRLGHRSTAILLACGAAAAVGAIFKAPITGVVFTLEILLIDMSMASIIPILIAAVTSTAIIYMLHGFEPVFGMVVDNTPINIGNIPYYLILAVLCGLVAFWIIFSSSVIESLFKKIKKQYVKWIIGGVVIGLLIFLFPPLYGQGYGSISDLLNQDTTSIFKNSIYSSFQDNSYVLLGALLLIMITKSIAMACTNAAGGVGGVFAPSIFLGAFTGFFTATALNFFFGLNLPVVSFTLVGMAGVMSGAMDSPMTAIFLIAEISGGYKLFLPLMLVSALAYAISYYFAPYSFYTRELVLTGDTMSVSKDRSMIYIDLNKLVENDFKTITRSMSLGELVDNVKHSKRNLFPVISSSGGFEGYVTLDDIRSDMFNIDLYEKNSVEDYMSDPLQIIESGDNISVILDKFDQSSAWNLPVLDKNNKYIGFVSKSKIFSEYRSELSK